MWTLVSSINFRAARRRAARPFVAATVLLGTCTHVAMALLPQPSLTPDTNFSPATGVSDPGAASAGRSDSARDTA